MKRYVDTIIIHCSATPEGKRLEPAAMVKMHRKRGFNGCGYHFYIRRTGEICDMRPVERIGAHCKGHNEGSIGICYEGGLDAKGVLLKTVDIRSPKTVISVHFSSSKPMAMQIY